MAITKQYKHLIYITAAVIALTLIMWVVYPLFSKSRQYDEFDKAKAELETLISKNDSLNIELQETKELLSKSADAHRWKMKQAQNQINNLNTIINEIEKQRSVSNTFIDTSNIVAVVDSLARHYRAKGIPSNY